MTRWLTMAEYQDGPRERERESVREGGTRFTQDWTIPSTTTHTHAHNNRQYTAYSSVFTGVLETTQNTHTLTKHRRGNPLGKLLSGILC